MPIVAPGADEFVEFHAKRGGKFTETVCVGSNEVLDAAAGRFRCAHILEAVVVGPALKEDLVASQSGMPRDGVGQYQF
ncbi:hypothetical protein D3C87_2122970 [compost metagenome]